MKHTILLLLTLVTLRGISQNHFVGIKAGSNLTNIKTDFLDTDKKLGFIGGITYEYHFNNHIILGADILFDAKGFSDKAFYTDDNNVPTGELTFDVNYNYLSVPLKVGYFVGNKFSGFINLGLVPSFLLDANLFQPPNEFGLPSGSFSLTDETPKVYVSGLIEIGANLILKEKLSLFTTFSYQPGFTTITNLGASNLNLKHTGISTVLGLKFAI